MAAPTATTPGPRAVNAALHPGAARRASPAPQEGTPPRRAVRRRFLLEAGATIATALGVTGAVLSPDPVWGAAEGSASVTLPGPDAELLRLCRAEVANCQRFDALAKASDAQEPMPKAIARGLDETVRRTWAAREAIAATPAHTLAGVRAKVEALRADCDPGAMGRGLAIADSLLDDLLRLLPAEGGRA